MSLEGLPDGAPSNLALDRPHSTVPLKSSHLRKCAADLLVNGPCSDYFYAFKTLKSLIQRLIHGQVTTDITGNHLRLLAGYIHNETKTIYKLSYSLERTPIVHVHLRHCSFCPAQTP